MARCNLCRSTLCPKPFKMASFSKLYRRFNDVLCVYHFILDGIRVFHDMSAASHYSSELVCHDLLLSIAIQALVTVWISSFWAPQSVQRDGSFSQYEFVNFLSRRSITFCPVLPHRHSKTFSRANEASFDTSSYACSSTTLGSILRLLRRWPCASRTNSTGLMCSQKLISRTASLVLMTLRQ